MPGYTQAPYQPAAPSYGPGGYGGYGPPPKKNNSAPLIIVVAIVVVALVVGLLIWGFSGNKPTGQSTPPTYAQSSNPVNLPTDGTTPTIPDNSMPPTSTDDTMAVTPFCMDYLFFMIDLAANWSNYQDARDKNDYSTADGYVSTFLSEIHTMQQDGPPANVTSSLNAMEAYLSKLHQALQGGSTRGITQADVDAYNDAYDTFMDLAETACYGD